MTFQVPVEGHGLAMASYGALRDDTKRLLGRLLVYFFNSVVCPFLMLNVDNVLMLTVARKNTVKCFRVFL